MIAIEHKQGDTLLLDCTYAGGLTGVLIASQARNSTGVVSTATVSVVNEATGEFRVAFAASDTATWTTRTVFVDIQMSTPDGVFSTKTFRVNVDEDITNVA